MTEYTRAELLKMLRSGTAEISFKKSDNTTRKALATLDKNVVTDSTGGTDRKMIVYWDLDKGAYRSFYVDSVKKAKKVA